MNARPDITVDVQQYAPPSERYAAIDRNTYDGEGRLNIIGSGATKRAAVRDLLEKLRDHTPTLYREVSNGPFEPSELIPLRPWDESVDGDEEAAP